MKFTAVAAFFAILNAVPGFAQKVSLIADGKHDKDFSVQHLVVNRESTVEVKMLRRGGFAACLVPVQ